MIIDKVRDAAPAARIRRPTSPADLLDLPAPMARAVVHHLDRWALDQRRVAATRPSRGSGRRADYLPLGVSPEVIHPPSCLEDPGSAIPAHRATSRDTCGRTSRPPEADGPGHRGGQHASMTRTWDSTIVGDGPDRRRLEVAAQATRESASPAGSATRSWPRLYRGAGQCWSPPSGGLRVRDHRSAAARSSRHHHLRLGRTHGARGHGPTDATRVRARPRRDRGAPWRTCAVTTLAAAPRNGGTATAAAALAGPRSPGMLERPPSRPLPPGRSGRIAALSTYPMPGWPGGGPERAGKLLGALAGDGWDVGTRRHLRRMAPRGRPSIAPGFTEVVRPAVTAPSRRRTQAAQPHRQRRRSPTSLRRCCGPPAQNSSRAARNTLDGARAVVAVQPYLAPVALELAPGSRSSR